MDFTPREVDDEHARRYVREGFWVDQSMGELLGTGLSDGAANAFVTRSDRHAFRGTIADVDALARRVATGLRARGIGPGDPVAFQLPNWLEAAATFYAVSYLGAVIVPIVHFYGPKEVGYILRKTRVKALITTQYFGHQNFANNLAQLREEGLPDLEWVAFVDTGEGIAGGDIDFADLAAADALVTPASVDPREPALIAYTSGTTSDPKGVVHSHRTINAEIAQLSAMMANRENPAMIVGAPVGHGIGMLAALLTPVFRRSAIHLIDVWDPGTVLAAMLAENLSSGQGSTFFLTSLLDHPDFDPDRHAKLMPFVGLGGSAVPAAVGERCFKLGIEVARSFGSTEHPSITGCRPEEPREKRINTDGRPLPGVELRLVDDDGKDVDAGTPGEIWSRGPDCFVGYTDTAATRNAFSADGWYMTGDIGVLDEDGFLAITDRKKDIIIRGGENVSAQEVEELLVRMPDVAEVAVVAAPDARLGEVACVFFRMQPGRPAPTLAEMRTHLDNAGLAKQKWPEHVRSVDEFPRTPSGKVQKFVLRERLRAEM
ncbi:MAG TPA: AMP-binding protein [Acidimicrobiia bacterium]|nr:AMP-binding protein [Acidimicrobiia bacterium]